MQKRKKKSEIREGIFVRKLLENGGNATQAYIDAGGTKNRKSAGVSAARKLAKASVKEKMQSLAERAGFDAVQVLTRLRQRAFFDPRNLFNADGSIKPIQTMDDDTACMVREIKTVELFEGEGDQKHCFGNVKEIKTSDPHHDLKLLGQHLKLFTEVKEHRGTVVIKSSIPRPARG